MSQMPQKEKRRKELERRTAPRALLMVMKLMVLWSPEHVLQCHNVILSSDLYKLTDEVLGQGAYAKVQGCISLQNGQEYAVKVSTDIVR